MATVGAWPVPWATYGRLGGVAGALGPVWSPWGVARPWVLYGYRAGVASPLGPVWPPWVRDLLLRPRMVAVGACRVPLA